MAEIEAKWIKVSINTFDDEKLKLIEGMPNVGESIENLWIKLLCLAGKINDNGYIYFSKAYEEGYNPELNNSEFVKPYTEEQLAIIFSKPIDIIRLALNTFVEFEMIIVDRFGVIFLQNFYKYQSIERLNDIKKERNKKVELIQKKIKNGEDITKSEKEILKKEQVRIRVQRYREKQKKNKKNVTQSHLLEDKNFINEEKNCNTRVTQNVTFDENLSVEKVDESIGNSDIERK